jgi:shikimate kinase
MTGEHPQAGRPEERGRPQAVALVGFMGAGKSAVGRQLAAALRIPFIDTDDLIVAEAGPIASIFAERGEAGFRALEADLVMHAISSAADRPCVLALGGGAVLSETVRAALKSLPYVVWLDAPSEELWARVASAGPRLRPLVADEPSFERLLAAREPLYRSVATEVVQTAGRSPAAILLAAREPLYRSVATEVVQTAGRSPAAIAAAVAAGLGAAGATASGDARATADHRSGGGS